MRCSISYTYPGICFWLRPYVRLRACIHLDDDFMFEVLPVRCSCVNVHCLFLWMLVSHMMDTTHDFPFIYEVVAHISSFRIHLVVFSSSHKCWVGRLAANRNLVGLDLCERPRHFVICETSNFESDALEGESRIVICGQIGLG